MVKSVKNVIAIGKFDGVHIGHRRLMEEAAKIARNCDFSSLVYIISPSNFKSITSKESRDEIIREIGIDSVITQPLTEEFKVLTPREFAENILVKKLNAAHVVVGYNFRFGVNRSGDAALLCRILKDYGVNVTVIDSINVKNASGDLEPVSSTRIRSLVETGDMPLAKECLGRWFSMWGVASCGKHLGAKIGFPTINFYPEKDELIPRRGVYVSKVLLDGKNYVGITNVGLNPTVESGKNIKVETHIPLLKAGDLYGKKVKVEFVEYIRSETKFKNELELKNQLECDKKYALSKLIV